jgi:hypothetical protein
MAWSARAKAAPCEAWLTFTDVQTWSESRCDFWAPQLVVPSPGFDGSSWNWPVNSSSSLRHKLGGQYSLVIIERRPLSLAAPWQTLAAKRLARPARVCLLRSN